MIEIPFVLDLQGADIGPDIQRALTDAANKAAKSTKAAVESATKSVVSNVGAASTALQKFGTLGEKISKVPIPGFSVLGRAVASLGETIAVLSNPLGIVTVTIGALASGVALAATSVVGATVAIVGLVAASGALEKQLKAFKDLEGFGVTPEDSKTLETARAAMSALSTVIAQVSVDYAAQWAPAITRVTTLMLAFGIAAVDTLQAARENAGSFSEFIAQTLADSVTRFNPFLFAIEKALEGLELLGVVSEGTGAKVREGAEQLAKWQANNVVGAATAGFVALESAAGDYLTRAQELTTRQAAVNRELKKTAEIKLISLVEEYEALAAAEKEAAEAIRSFDVERSGEIGQINAKIDDQIAKLREVAALAGETEFITERIATLEAERAADIRGLQTQQLILDKLTAQEKAAKKLDKALAHVSITANTIGQFGGLADELTNVDIQVAEINEKYAKQRKELDKLIDAGGDREAIEKQIVKLNRQEQREIENTKEAKKGLFIAAKSAAIAEATGLGAVATVRAYAELGPIAASIVVAGALAGVIAQSLATIRETKLSFAHGGMVPRNGQGRIPATLEPGESVLNSRATDGLGRRMIDALNAGTAQNAPQAPRIVFRDRDVSHVVGRVLDGPTSLGDRFRAMAGPQGRMVWTL